MDSVVQESPDPMEIVVGAIKGMESSNKKGSTFQAICNYCSKGKSGLSSSAVLQALELATNLNLITRDTGGCWMLSSETDENLEGGNGSSDENLDDEDDDDDDDLDSDDEAVCSPEVHSTPVYQVTGLSPPASVTPQTPAPMDVSFETKVNAPLTPQVADLGTPIKFPGRHRTVVAHLAMRVLKLVDCPKSLEGCRMWVEWSWGSKEGNKGRSDRFTVTQGTAMVVHNMQVVTSFSQELPSKQTEPNRMNLSLHVERPSGGPCEMVAQRSIDMAQFNADRCEKTKSFAMDKRQPAMSLLLSVLTTWLKIDGRKVERTVDGFGARIVGDGPEIEAMPIASPTQQLPGVAPRVSNARSSRVSPVVKDQKAGSTPPPLPTAATKPQLPAPTMEIPQLVVPHRSTSKGLLAQPTAVSSSPTPAAAAKHEESPLRRVRAKLVPSSSPSKMGGSSSPAGGISSPFFRKKESSRKEVASPSAVPSAASSPAARPVNRPLFGASIEQAMQLQKASHPHLRVPYIVHYCCKKVLELDGQKSEGIFRVSINSDDVEIYSRNFEKGDFNLPPKDPNYPAVLIKHYLRSLPQPLCPDYDACVAAARLPEEACQKAVADIFAKLPVHNQELLKYIANYMYKIGDPKNAVHSKMEVPALCIVFAPATLKNPVLDIASVMTNQVHERNFMEQLVKWIHNKYPDDTVGTDDAATSRAPRRKAPPPPPSAAPAATSTKAAPPQLKKRKSTLDVAEVGDIAPTESLKGRKISESDTPSHSSDSLNNNNK